MQRWLDLSLDPNDRVCWKVAELPYRRLGQRSRLATVCRIFCDLARGKSVLDIGVVEHTRDAATSMDWLHGHLKRHASRCLGVDLLEEEVKYLRAQGYEIIVADITQSPLPEKFDVIIGDEVLEHLDAPGMFMKNCAAMLKSWRATSNHRSKSLVHQCDCEKLFQPIYVRRQCGPRGVV